MTINFNNMQRLSATGSFMMPKIQINLDESKILQEVVEDEIEMYKKTAGGFPRQFEQLMEIIATAQKTVKGDAGYHEMTLKMRLHNLRCCADLLAKNGFDDLQRQFEEAAEYHTATPACIEKYKQNLRF